MITLPAVENTRSLGTDVAVIHWYFWAPWNNIGNWTLPTLNHHLIGSSCRLILGKAKYFFISRSTQSFEPSALDEVLLSASNVPQSSSPPCKKFISTLLSISHLSALVSSRQESQTLKQNHDQKYLPHSLELAPHSFHNHCHSYLQLRHQCPQ